MSHYQQKSGQAGTALVLMAVASVAALVGPTPVPAAAVTTAPAPKGITVIVRSGPDHQTDPHVSGNLVSYTNSGWITSEIRYRDLATGTDAAVPNGGHRDSLSDISGTTIVFRRDLWSRDTVKRAIMAFDTATPGVPPAELDPQPGTHRTLPAIGGRTVAWVQYLPDSFTTSNIAVYDLDTRVATPLSDDEDRANTNPSVSADGSVVTWMKCESNSRNCDVFVATKAGGSWTTRAITGPPREDFSPDTNGVVVVYAIRNPSDSSFDVDIAWQAVDGTTERVLALPGREHRPNVTGALVSFESDEVTSVYSDLWLYDMGTETVYQLTNTPTVDETLNDISIGPDGLVHVAWAQADGSSSGDHDLYAMSFRLGANAPPDCSGVSASAGRLWPPDHKLQPVSLAGVTDPDGDAVTLAVTGVTQDEAVNGVDDGNTAPDAQLGPASDQLLLRGERSAAGNGRVYRIAFTATDAGGATCSGVVTVGVPVVRDGAVTDSGASYDSLAS